MTIVMAWSAVAQPQRESEPAQSIQPVKAMVVGNQQQVTPFAAEVSATLHAAMAFRISGELRGLYVRMGQFVRQGQLLAELDPTDYELAVQARQAELDLAAIRSERDAKLFERKLISEDQYDRSRTDLQVARARLAQAQTDLNDTRLRAPFDGYVALTHARAGEVMAANQMMMQLENNDQVDISFNLPVQYGAEMLEADTLAATVSFTGRPGRYLGARVKEFASQPDPDTNSYRVTLSLPRPHKVNALTGMNAWVELSTLNEEMQPVPLPKGAVVKYKGDNPVVWRIDPATDTLSEVEVTVDEQGLVVSGLSRGDRIVAAGASRLMKGQKVRVWERERGI
ncbi:efflux RND transporter periplasmic adaptor subunit [Ferrimonas futtsuensis]|uniref:efflux RND transporter periplasmic adaptor subunit n=1 Tax=Ferrimonas futtsuensis TaxID=364764 RepID=UPI00146B5D7F|nr:efflux RND transporter periplasmic adaptor subunit [Ferrimonas futtsuensis]